MNTMKMSEYDKEMEKLERSWKITKRISRIGLLILITGIVIFRIGSISGIHYDYLVIISVIVMILGAILGCIFFYRSMKEVKNSRKLLDKFIEDYNENNNSFHS